MWHPLRVRGCRGHLDGKGVGSWRTELRLCPGHLGRDSESVHWETHQGMAGPVSFLLRLGLVTLCAERGVFPCPLREGGRLDSCRAQLPSKHTRGRGGRAGQGYCKEGLQGQIRESRLVESRSENRRKGMSRWEMGFDV